MKLIDIKTFRQLINQVYSEVNGFTSQFEIPFMNEFFYATEINDFNQVYDKLYVNIGLEF